MTDDCAVFTQNLTKSYGNVQALRGVDLEVRRGEIFGFLGPNGAGKTTSIRCFLDLIRPDGGRVEVLGLDPQKHPVAVRSRTGYLPGELHFEQNLRIEGVLRYFNQLRGKKADWRFVGELADKLELDQKAQIKNLSKGNKQKIGIIQALMHHPELLLLDEPTSGLDPLVQKQVLRLIRGARDGGATVFFSSHVLSEVQEIADRVGIIRQGKVVEVAETDTLIHRSLRRARVRFRQDVDPAVFAGIPGIRVLSQEDGTIWFQVEGEMDGLIKALAAYPVRDFETERPSLEEVFLAYYEG